MLGDTEEYARYKALERLSLYDTVEIFHPDLGLSTAVQVKGYEWDALAQRYTKITLGDVFDRARHTVTGYDLSDGCISYRKFSGEVIAALKNDLA
jgi:phage-related protein